MGNEAGLKSKAMEDVALESLRETVREAARRASPKVVEALSQKMEESPNFPSSVKSMLGFCLFKDS